MNTIAYLTESQYNLIKTVFTNIERLNIYKKKANNLYEDLQKITKEYHNNYKNYKKNEILDKTIEALQKQKQLNIIFDKEKELYKSIIALNNVDNKDYIDFNLIKTLLLITLDDENNKNYIHFNLI